MSDADALLTAAEEDVTAVVRAVLDEVAAEFAADLADADEIVAARFSVSRIGRMFTSRMPRIVRRLLGVAETATTDAAESVDAAPPDGWDDLPGRYDDDRLPPPLRTYVETTEHLLRAVGDRLADVATRELAAGLDAGETIDQLRARLRTAFAREGAQLGDVREERIARTESARAWNHATLAAGQELSGPDRPLVKQWTTRRDSRVRDTHDRADGQLQLLDDPFTVGGVAMRYPGDPTAPPELVINCRCVLRLATADRTAAYETQDGAAAAFKNQRKEPAVAQPVTAAADGSHLQGAMIALIPTDEGAARLALDGGEDAGELHLTLFFLGDDGTAWTEEQRTELTAAVRARAADLGGPIYGRAFGANHWNAGSDSPSWVWAVGDDRDASTTPALEDARNLVAAALEDTHGPELPTQHAPWAAHVCAAYSDDPELLAALQERLGPITFDRIRVAFAGDHTDIPLGPDEEAPMEDPTPAAVTAAWTDTRSWSTPDTTALAFENTETGDGRIFAPGALFWEGGPWPLQYAEEMLMGHEGAELAGAINALGRDGDRITGTGVLYAGRYAGADAITLLEQQAPLGVSVDLDDVDIEFVDRTANAEDGGLLFASACLPSMSVLRMEDGAWMLSASTTAQWAASGLAFTRDRHSVQLITTPGGQLSAAAVRAAFAHTGALTAAAGDKDDPEAGVVVHSEAAGDLLLRITRARVRGATLVAMPAYDQARIVLDPLSDDDEGAEDSAAAETLEASSDTHRQVIAYVSASPIAVGAREVATALGIGIEAARGHLARAHNAGELVRLARGLYIGPSDLPEGADATAAASEQPTDADLSELEASAWTAMRDLPPMPAEWFREPTAQELPPGSGGVHYAGGRIFGWVAQAGEPHAGMPGRNLTIESLGRIDLTHFLRARFQLDNGETVRAGAFTMNVGHHRDGAECETDACQFDDTRTVAGIVTVGMNARGMWFSGAAAPHLSEWDRQVFSACQPSYHMKKGNNGRWQLRAVLSVPVPGHSSPLLAAAVIERANLALAASAALAQEPATPPTVAAPGPGTRAVPTPTATPAPDVAALAAALLTDGSLIDALTAAIDRRDSERRAEVAALAALVAGPTTTAHEGAQ
ncbi:phage minor head protein [Streptomyces sp. ME03-5709C]|nr:phage minor head protein [Streptomyces sp. ME03-5709C]